MSRATLVMVALAAAAVVSAAVQTSRARNAGTERDRQLETLISTEADATRIAASNFGSAAASGAVQPQRVASVVALSMEEAGLASQTPPTVSSAETSPSRAGGRELLRVGVELPPLSESDIGLALERLEQNLAGWTCTRVTLRARPDRAGGRPLYTASLTFLGFGVDE